MRKIVEIDFCTSAELVDELSKRSTFAGVVFRSENEVRTNENLTIYQKWDITYAKLSAKQVCELLEDAVKHFRQLAENELD